MAVVIQSNVRLDLAGQTVLADLVDLGGGERAYQLKFGSAGPMPTVLQADVGVRLLGQPILADIVDLGNGEIAYQIKVAGGGGGSGPVTSGPQGPPGQSGPSGPQGASGPSGPGIATNSEHFNNHADATSPVEVIQSNILVFELSDSLTSGVIASIKLPKGLNLNVNPVVNYAFTITLAGSGNANVRLQLEATYIADTELTSIAVAETFLVTVPVVNQLRRLHQITFTLDRTLIAANDRVRLHLSRLGGDAADTYTGDIGILESGRFDYEV